MHPLHYGGHDLLSPLPDGSGKDRLLGWSEECHSGTTASQQLQAEPATDRCDVGQAPGPGKAPARAAADIINIIEARAGAVTRSNTLFLAGVGARVDWVADLGKEGRRVGRFTAEEFTSDDFNQSNAGGTAWLGNPQAVGCLSWQVAMLPVKIRT